MSNEDQIEVLISKSLRHTLDRNETAAVEKHLNENEDARKFAELSRLIQNSVSGIQLEESASDSAVLTEQARSRLKDSIRDAVQEKLSLSTAGLIAPGETRQMSRSKTHVESVISDSQRQVSSRFKLIRRLGEGGLGNVWLARDEKINRNVALKELRPEALESPKAWERFHREAEITGHLEHPNVVPLYQFGTDRVTGEPFYAMRFVGKRTLADAIVEFHDRVQAGEDCFLGLHRLLTAFLDVCQAIAYAHSRGVVHRDLKPENVALDNFGQVIVLDWGLAKVLEDSELRMKMSGDCGLENSACLMQTMEGDVVGTPLYMAPEQAIGDLDNVDDKTDIYGLGAILFSILTGRAPHEKSAYEAGSQLSDVLNFIASADSPTAEDYGKKVPRELERICSKALAHKRHLRFDTVQDLATAVETWMAGQSEKKSGYERLRMEGRELRADLQSSVNNLERNARFAAALPPIEQLMRVKSDEDVAIWRERLATIYAGMLRTNLDYQSIVYSKIENGAFTELVRVERNGSESAGIRVVPKSRLHSDSVNGYIETLTKKKPEDVHTSLVCDPLCERGEACNETVGLLSGVPVYDNETEDVFGIVMINCDINKILKRQMSRRLSAGEVVAACDTFNIMMHNKDGHVVENSLSAKVADETPHFVDAVEHLQKNLEFIDEADSNVYGARIWFVNNVHGLMYLLKR